MSKNYRAVPIRDESALDKAIADGAVIEFDGNGSSYDLPPYPHSKSGGWIIGAGDIWRNRLRNGGFNDGEYRLRAIYPGTATKPSILSRVRRFFVSAKEAA